MVSSSDFSSASLKLPKPPIFRVGGQILVLRAPELAGLMFRSAFNLLFFPAFKPYRSGTLLLKASFLGFPLALVVVLLPFSGFFASALLVSSLSI